MKDKWWAKREAALTTEFAGKEDALRAELSARFAALETAKKDADAAYQRLQDRKQDLEQSTAEVTEHLRLIEAKATPSSVWAIAFTEGFSKAWDMMLPLMREGVQKSQDVIFEEAANATLANLETAIVKRLEQAGMAHLKTANELLAKQREIEESRRVSKSAADRQRYDNYLEVIKWMVSLNGH